MATRNRTIEYQKLRSTIKTSPFLGSKKGGNIAEMNDFEEGFLKRGRGESVSGSITPAWLEGLQFVKTTTEDIKKRMESLNKLHNEHLQPAFGKNVQEEERKIEIITREIKTLFQKCEKEIKDIGTMAAHEDLTPEEQAIRKNIQKSLVTQLTDLSQKFKQNQKQYLQKMKGQRDRARELTSFDEESEERAQRIQEIEDRMYDPGFTPEQIQQMILNEEMINQHDREITDILRSMTEIHEMFKDLSTLVIHQGTILDRIDYNIEQTLEHTIKAEKELTVAENHQKSSRMKLCMIFLIVVACLIALVLVLKLVLKLSF